MTPCGYGTDGCGFFDAGHDPHRTAAVNAGAHPDVQSPLDAAVVTLVRKARAAQVRRGVTVRKKTAAVREPLGGKPLAKLP